MACLQNGTSLLNNNNLSSFKHNIMKYDETHANVYTSPINNFLNKQIPFRNNHTKDKTQSDSNVFNEEKEDRKERGQHGGEDEAMKHSCVNNKIRDTVDEDEKKTTTNRRTVTVVNNNTRYKKQNDVLRAKRFECFKCDSQNANDDDVWLETSKNANTSDNDDNSYQREFPSDKGTAEQQQSPSTSTPTPTETGEPSHHARRPMNAFLIFCKRHRTIVKNRYPHLENRAVTKILGEWWAGLEPEDKACYTELAKQYKNAFFSANPNFKWYKLPAPPLRTLNTRPGNIVKSPPPPKDMQEVEEQPQQLFTPGKLADETQLGSITSLINSNNQHGSNSSSNIINTQSMSTLSSKNNTITDTDTINEDEQPEVLSSSPDNYKNYLLSPPNSSTITMCQPPKPLKKRLVSTQNTATDTKNIVRSIFSSTNDTGNKTDGNIFDSSLLQQALQSFVIDEAFEGDFNLDFRALGGNTNSNLTQQELINKVVDHMCSTKTDSNDADEMDEECNTCMQNQDESRETRKSVRSCKGLLYAKFMAEGKLFVSKRSRKNLSTTITTTTTATATKLPKPSFASSIVSDKVPRNTEPIELSDTIKKLAERTIGSSAKTTTSATPYNMKIMDHHSGQPETEPDTNQNELSQESREETMKKMFRAADFNLDEKIEALPSLSLDKFQQKKKENKKRKFLRATKMKDTIEQRKKISHQQHPTEPNARSEHDDKNAVNLIGSRKRKPIGKPRKQSERALEDNKQNINNNNNNNNNSNNNNNLDADADADEATSEIDLFGLATLAEVAAKKAKIDQNE